MSDKGVIASFVLVLVAALGWVGYTYLIAPAMQERQCDRARERLADAQVSLNAILNMMPNIDPLKQPEVWDHQRLHDAYVAACGDLATKYRTERAAR